MKGYCGINCLKCECYMASSCDDVLKMITVAIKWSKLFNKTILPREINCTGCKSEGVQFSNCQTCKIRKEFE